MRKELYFSEHLLISESYNLGLMYKGEGKLERALHCYEAAMRIREKVLHEDHPAMAELMNNLGQLYLDLGEFQRSRQFHYQALAINVNSLGSDHCKVGDTKLNLGLVHEECLELEDAASFFKAALEVYSKSYPPSHHLCQSATECLQRVSQQQADLRRSDHRRERFIHIHFPSHLRTEMVMAVRSSRILQAFSGSHWGRGLIYTSALRLDLDQIIFEILLFAVGYYVKHCVGEADKGVLRYLWLMIPYFIGLAFVLKAIKGERICRDFREFLFFVCLMFLYTVGYHFESYF